MEDRERTLVVLLSMHRCGSSVTTSILQRLGMSLGPFALIDADASNPYGHFEAKPFHRLNRQIQGLVYGFMDDLPGSPQITARFCETRGEWDQAIHIPEELFDEGRSLIRTLIDSGQVSGFKDPRTVLTWPFWKQVLADFPDLRVIPLGLLLAARDRNEPGVAPRRLARVLGITRRDRRPFLSAEADRGKRPDAGSRALLRQPRLSEIAGIRCGPVRAHLERNRGA